jgi:hypothetical protein
MAAHDASTHHASADDEYLNPAEGSGHEHTDTNVWMIVQFAIWLAASAVVVHVLMWVMFRVFVTQREAVSAPEFPLAVGEPALELLRLDRSQRRDGTHPDHRRDAVDARARTAVAHAGSA